MDHVRLTIKSGQQLKNIGHLQTFVWMTSKREDLSNNPFD